MSDTNPFASSQSPGGTPTASENALYTANTYLAQTRPWLVFLGVIGVLFGLLAVLSGIGVGISTVLSGLAGDEGDMPMMLFGPAFGLVYAIFGLVYTAPAVMMLLQAKAIGKVANGGWDAVNDVLRHSRNFWRFAGGLTLLMIVLYCGGIGLVASLGAGAFLPGT